jgi:hypothetical protein
MKELKKQDLEPEPDPNSIPDPLVMDTDLQKRIRIHTEMSLIHCFLFMSFFLFYLFIFYCRGTERVFCAAGAEPVFGEG